MLRILWSQLLEESKNNGEWDHQRWMAAMTSHVDSAKPRVD